MFGNHYIKIESLINTTDSQMGIHWCHFQLYISHKATKSIAKLISQLCGELQLAVCLSIEDRAIKDDPVLMDI